MRAEELAQVIAGATPETWNRDGQWEAAFYRVAERVLAHLAREQEERATEQEEAFEVWSAEVCKHGKDGTHANLKVLAECLLSELREVRVQAAAHATEIAAAGKVMEQMNNTLAAERTLRRIHDACRESAEKEVDEQKALVARLVAAIREYFDASSRVYAESGNMTTPKARAKTKLLALCDEIAPTPESRG